MLVLGGETLTRVSGLSDDNPPIELPDIPLYETHFGHDGTMYAMGTSMQGGDVKVKLLPTSQTNARWLGVHAQIQKGVHIIWHGLYHYDTVVGGLQQSWGFALRGGVTEVRSSRHGRRSERRMDVRFRADNPRHACSELLARAVQHELGDGLD